MNFWEQCKWYEPPGIGLKGFYGWCRIKPRQACSGPECLNDPNSDFDPHEPEYAQLSSGRRGNKAPIIDERG